MKFVNSVCKSFSFCYAHYLPDYDGKCSQLHGHNSRVEVTIQEDFELKPRRPYQSMVVDFGELKQVVNTILERLDHKCLNDVIHGPPTAENIAFYIGREISLNPKIGAGLKRVRVYETDDSYAQVDVVWEEDEK